MPGREMEIAGWRCSGERSVDGPFAVEFERDREAASGQGRQLALALSSRRSRSVPDRVLERLRTPNSSMDGTGETSRAVSKKDDRVTGGAWRLVRAGVLVVAGPGPGCNSRARSGSSASISKLWSPCAEDEDEVSRVSADESPTGTGISSRENCNDDRSNALLPGLALALL